MCLSHLYYRSSVMGGNSSVGQMFPLNKHCNSGRDNTTHFMVRGNTQHTKLWCFFAANYIQLLKATTNVDFSPPLLIFSGSLFPKRAAKVALRREIKGPSAGKIFFHSISAKLWNPAKIFKWQYIIFYARQCQYIFLRDVQLALNVVDARSKF